MRALGDGELSLEVHRTIRKDPIESEEAIPTRDQQAWVTRLTVDPCAIGYGRQPASRGYHHTEGGRG